MATTSPRSWRSATGVLVLGEDLGEDLVDAELGGDGVGDLLGVAGDHRHPHPGGVQGVDGLAGHLAHLVLEGEAPSTPRRRPR
jgi:hypothetical protein